MRRGRNGDRGHQSGPRRFWLEVGHYWRAGRAKRGETRADRQRGSRGYRQGRENVLSKRAGTASWPRVARRCAGFSRPQLEPEEEGPEEAHPRRHIAKAL